MLALILFYAELRKSSIKIVYYEKEISRLAASFEEIEQNVNQRILKQNAAELLLNNTNKILSDYLLRDGRHR